MWEKRKVCEPHFQSPQDDTWGSYSQPSFIVRKPVVIKVFSWNTQRLNTAPSPDLPSLGTSCSHLGNTDVLGMPYPSRHWS